MAGTILLVEDEEEIASLVKAYLERDGFRVVWAARGVDGLLALEQHEVRLAILDLQLPDADGLDLCRAIRAAVAAADRDPDRARRGDRPHHRSRARRRRLRREAVLAARAGRADARGAAARGAAPRRTTIATLGEIAVDRGARAVTVAGEAVELTAKEFDLLAYFIEHAGLVLSRDRLLDRVWGLAFPGGTRTVDVHVAQLRQQARPARADPDDPRLRLQGGRALIRVPRGRLAAQASLRRDRGERSRLDPRHAARRRVPDAALARARERSARSARQVDLIAAQRSREGDRAPRCAATSATSSPPSRSGWRSSRPTRPSCCCPRRRRGDPRGGKPATGTVELHGTRYLYAARRNGSEALVLLRSARKQSSDWTPFLAGLGHRRRRSARRSPQSSRSCWRARSRARSRRVAEPAGGSPRASDPEPLPVRAPTRWPRSPTSFNHLAAELDHAQDAERAFLLSVSHELKTPLTVDPRPRRGAAGRRGRRAHAGAVIEREAGRLERLIRDLLDLARLRRRAFSVGRGRSICGDAARDVVARYQPQSRRVRRVAVRRRRAGRAWPRGTPTASSRPSRTSSRTPSAALLPAAPCACSPRPGRIDVVDDGPGLGPDDLEHAFERFYLYERYGADRPVGTGLGLAIVRELAEAMGGEVDGAAARPASARRSRSCSRPLRRRDAARP